jgi:hypothetical protein
MRVGSTTNLRVLRRSRQQLVAGDVFRMQLPSGLFLFGRVMIARASRDQAPMPEANLLYIFKDVRSSAVPDRSSLLPSRLLIAPVWTNRIGWHEGLFETVDSYPIGPLDSLRQHCFWDAVLEEFLDEKGLPIAEKVEPCGLWGLVSYRWIDDQISDALGIPRAPDDGKEN